MKTITQRRMTTGAAALALAGLLAAPAVAQSYESKDKGDKSKQKSSQQHAEKQRSSQQGQSSQEQARLRLEPKGWVGVAYDLDDDQQFDAYEYVYSFDLERASRDSQQRTQRQARMQRTGDQRTSQGQRTGSRNVVADPEGWVMVAYDTDQDGSYEVYEYIQAYDLQRARSASQQRMRQQGMSQRGMQQAMARQGKDQRGMRQRTQERMLQVQGDVEKLKTVNLAGMDEPHVLAVVRTQDGRKVPVDLGPKSDLEDLKLSKGDSVQAQAREGRINESRVLMAVNLRAGGEQIRVRRDSGEDLRRFKATVLDTRTATSRQEGDERLLAKVRLRDGRTTLVDLGRTDEISADDLTQGQTFALLAVPKRINGQQGLCAREVHVDGETIKLKSHAKESKSQSRQAAMARGGNGTAAAREASAQRDQQEARTIRMDASDYRFDPERITVAPGQKVRLKLENLSDHDRHDIEIRTPEGRMSLDTPLEAGETGTLTFTAPEQPGTYTFYCPIGDHRVRGMEGRLVVRERNQM